MLSDRCRERLAELDYPTIPQLHISRDRFKDLPETEHSQALQGWLEGWLSENEIDVETKAVVVKPAVASCGAGLYLANGLDETLGSIATLIDRVSLHVHHCLWLPFSTLLFS